MLSREHSGAIKIDTSPASNQTYWRLFLLVSLPAWFLYLSMLSPTITQGGDCGELVSASYFLGVAHPSGYSIWCMLSRAFALIPFGEIAWRYNLFSAVCGAISAGLLALASFEILQQPIFAERAQKNSAFWAALACGLLFAGFYYAASQFLIAEVYSLASLWGSLIVWLALRWHFGDDWRDAYTLAFCAGIAPLIHLSSVFLLPWLFILAVRGKRFSAPKIVTVVSLFFLGWISIFYFPIRSAQFPDLPEKNLKVLSFYPLDWTHTADLSNLPRHITARQYSNLLIEEYQTVENGKTVTKKRMAQPISKIPERLQELLVFIPLQFLWATPLLFVGIYNSFKVRGLGWILLLILIGNIGIEINYKVPDLTNFFFPSYFVMAIWMGLGWFTLFNLAFRRDNLFAKVAPLFLIGTVVCQWFIFYSTLNARNETLNRDIGVVQAAAAQKLAQAQGKRVSLFFGSDDSLWRFWYAKYVLNDAPNVETPWGRLSHRHREAGDWYQDVAYRKQAGPVLMAEWDANTDKRYPYVLGDDTGLLWLASDQAVPDTAVATGQTTDKTGVISAQIRRSPLWKRAANNDINLLAGILMGIDVQFALPADWQSAPVKGFNGKIVPNAQSGGTIELKVGKKGDVQRRRLILPANWKPGQIFKATVPLDVKNGTPIGRYGVWARIADAATAPKATPWRESDYLRTTR